MYLFLVWLHIVAAMVWIGGAVFLVLVLVPALRLPECRDAAGLLLRVTGGRLRTMGWVCLGTLVITGTMLLSHYGVHVRDLVSEGFYRTSFGQTVGVKVFLVLVILGLSLLHDLVVGPRARDLMICDPTSSAAVSARLQASWIGRLTLFLGLVVVMLAVYIVRGRPF